MTCRMGMRALRVAAVACAAVMVTVLSLPAEAQQVQNPRLRIAEDKPIKPTNRVFFNYNYFSAVVEGGGTFGSTDGGLSGTFGATPPGGSARNDSSFIGVDIQIPLSIFFNPQSMARLPFTPVVGASVRENFGSGGSVPFHIHPTPNPTTLTFQRQSSATFYGGVRVAVGDVLGNGSNVVITPRAGVNIENGRLTLVTDEAGPVTRLARSRTATGFHGGVDVDFFFPNAGNGLFVPFFGGGVYVNTIPDVSLVGQSALFEYRARTGSDVNVGLKGRLGVAFGAR